MLLNTCHKFMCKPWQLRHVRTTTIRSLLFFFSALLLECISCVYAAEDDKPLDFAFTQEAPGEKVEIDNFRLHVSCMGSGDTTVLFEAGLGGSSLEWIPIQKKISERVRACIYDRAGYAWSDPSPHASHAHSLSREADIMLKKIGADGPLLLVGHSFGGFVVRELALRRESKMIGMVLVDASHEDQLVQLEKLVGKNMMPSGTSFFVSPPNVPESLPDAIKRKIKAFSRMRKTYAALHSEMQFFRESASQVKRDRAVVAYPVAVVSRGLDLYASQELGEQKTAIWEALQKDLEALSPQSRRFIARKSGHHVHTENPDLIVRVIEEILDNTFIQNAGEGQ